MTPAKIIDKLKKLRVASRELRSVGSNRKNAVLKNAATLLSERIPEIMKANGKDLKALRGGTSAFVDRLTLTPSRIAVMAASLNEVAALPDPVGEIVDRQVLRNGLQVRRVRSPLGVIYMIFESRPNVAIEAFSLAFKAGNVIILRPGKEALRTTAVLFEILEECLKREGFSPDVLWGIKDPDRKLTQFLLKQREWIDVVVPRGGDGLIEYVTKNSEIPIIKNDRGMCHVYLHEDGDIAMTMAIVENAKTQRPGVCNAMETLLVHRAKALELLPKLYASLEPKGVQWFTCAQSTKILKGRKLVKSAGPKNWDTEYLDLKMNCRVVDSLDEAIAHIEAHGSRHSEAIITHAPEVARRFQSEVDAAAVYWNASTRFTDGFELGLGGELGISTQKLHVRGPVGLKELTNTRWIMDGKGQIRS